MGVPRVFHYLCFCKEFIGQKLGVKTVIFRYVCIGPSNFPRYLKCSFPVYNKSGVKVVIEVIVEWILGKNLYHPWLSVVKSFLLPLNDYVYHPYYKELYVYNDQREFWRGEGRYGKRVQRYKNTTCYFYYSSFLSSSFFPFLFHPCYSVFRYGQPHLPS